MESYKTVYLACLLLVSSLFVGCESKNSTGPKVLVTVTVFIEDDTGKPVAGANITTSPVTHEVVSDSGGKAVFEDIPADKYNFYINRTDYDTFTHTVTLNKNNLQDITIVLDTKAPVVKILFPQPDKFISRYNIQFIGEGTDLEDGVLPDSSLVWHSDIDGELGRGKELQVELLATGNHTITLEGIDTAQKKNTVTINVSAGDYYSSSYFPNPGGAVWQYQHEEEIFNTESKEGVSEAWELSKINVTVGGNTRTSTMEYKVRSSKYIKEYKYIVSDELEIEN
ncbi:carboxypeptidase-like regulatory domain-containing protein, partial [Candidatus Latescibacterota bacterium]